MVLRSIGVANYPRIVDVDLEQVDAMGLDYGSCTLVNGCLQELFEQRTREENGVTMFARVGRHD